MKKFEYKEVRMSDLRGPNSTAISIDKLNELGQEGWELTQIVGGHCIFKRELEVEV